MTREAGLYFLAALLFVASAMIDVAAGEPIDTGDVLSLVAAALMAFLGIRANRARSR